MNTCLQNSSQVDVAHSEILWYERAYFNSLLFWETLPILKLEQHTFRSLLSSLGNNNLVRESRSRVLAPSRDPWGSSRMILATWGINYIHCCLDQWKLFQIEKENDNCDHNFHPSTTFPCAARTDLWISADKVAKTELNLIIFGVCGSDVSVNGGPW